MSRQLCVYSMIWKGASVDDAGDNDSRLCWEGQRKAVISSRTEVFCGRDGISLHASPGSSFPWKWEEGKDEDEYLTAGAAQGPMPSQEPTPEILKGKTHWSGTRASDADGSIYQKSANNCARVEACPMRLCLQ